MWHEGATSLVAVLAGDDWPVWSGQEAIFNLSYKGQPSRVSPNGRYLAFMSDRPLTGYDNRDANSGKPDEQVFLFDALQGRLVCVSCNPTGARPTGVEYAKLNNGLAGGDQIWPEEQSLAANIPAWTAFEGQHARYQSRYLSNSGRLFFNSSDALVAQDINNNEDVYQYEPAGRRRLHRRVAHLQPVGRGLHLAHLLRNRNRRISVSRRLRKRHRRLLPHTGTTGSPGHRHGTGHL